MGGELSLTRLLSAATPRPIGLRRSPMDGPDGQVHASCVVAILFRSGADSPAPACCHTLRPKMKLPGAPTRAPTSNHGVASPLGVWLWPRRFAGGRLTAPNRLAASAGGVRIAPGLVGEADLSSLARSTGSSRSPAGSAKALDHGQEPSPAAVRTMAAAPRSHSCDALDRHAPTGWDDAVSVKSATPL